MSQTSEKLRLRKQFLNARDSLSLDFIKIASSRIRDNLRKLESFRNAKSIGAYYSIGSEVRTEEVLQEIWNHGINLALPRVEANEIVFRKILKISDIQLGNFSIMEPKDRCDPINNLDIVLVPAIALSRDGYRLGYGFGFYDRYLYGKKSTKIALSYAKQVVKSLPHENHDMRMDFIVTEDEIIGLN